MARLNEVFLLVDQRRRHGFQGDVADVLPQAHQIFVVALDLGLGALGAGRAHDQPHAVGRLQALDDALQALAVGGRRDLAADAAAAGGVGHQHAIAAGQRQVGGEGRALVAALFLDHLDQHDLAALDHFLDLVAAHQPAATARQLFFHHVVVIVADVLVAVLAIALVGVVMVVVVDVLGLLAHQRFAVGEGDLVVVRVDFVEGQEAVAVAAIFDERRLQAGFDAGYLGQIDVAAQLLLGAALEIKFVDTGSVDHHHAGLFGVGGVDQHSLRHYGFLHGLSVRPAARHQMPGRGGRRAGAARARARPLRPRIRRRRERSNCGLVRRCPSMILRAGWRDRF